jgi:hypothetical protein
VPNARHPGQQHEEEGDARGEALVGVLAVAKLISSRAIVSQPFTPKRGLRSAASNNDSQFKAVLDAIRALMAAPATTKRKIGFRSE